METFWSSPGLSVSSSVISTILPVILRPRLITRERIVTSILPPETRHTTFLPLIGNLLNNAAAASDITKTNNIYTQTFKATEDIDINSIAVKAGVLDTAVNYKEKYETMILAFDEIYRVSYEFVSGSGGKEIPEEIMRLLPKDEKPYENNTIAAAIQPDRTEVKVTDGVWKFKGYDADSKTANANITFVGTWIFTEAAPGETPDDEITDGSQTGDNGNPALWSVLFLLALGGMAGIALHAGKRRTN